MKRDGETRDRFIDRETERQEAEVQGIRAFRDNRQGPRELERQATDIGETER